MAPQARWGRTRGPDGRPQPHGRFTRTSQGRAAPAPRSGRRALARTRIRVHPCPSVVSPLQTRWCLVGVQYVSFPGVLSFFRQESSRKNNILKVRGSTFLGRDAKPAARPPAFFPPARRKHLCCIDSRIRRLTVPCFVPGEDASRWSRCSGATLGKERRGRRLGRPGQTEERLRSL